MNSPEESIHTAQQEADYSEQKTESADEIKLLAELDGEAVGTAGIGCAARKDNCTRGDFIERYFL